MSEEIRVVNPATGGAKGMKPERLSLIPWDAVRLISRASHYGSTKYGDPKVGPCNWRRGYEYSLTYDALQRHLASFWEGEDNDPDSGLPHLAHAGWHILTLIYFTLRFPRLDDRPHRWLSGEYSENQPGTIVAPAQKIVLDLPPAVVVGSHQT